jgi:hypothetical protein
MWGVVCERSMGSVVDKTTTQIASHSLLLYLALSLSLPTTVPLAMGMVAASVLFCTNGRLVMETGEASVRYVLECVNLHDQTHAAHAVDMVTHSELFLQTKEAVSCETNTGSVVCQLCSWVLPAVSCTPSPPSLPPPPPLPLPLSLSLSIAHTAYGPTHTPTHEPKSYDHMHVHTAPPVAGGTVNCRIAAAAAAVPAL